MGKGKGTGSGRPKKETPKRISGTGYNVKPPSMKYVKQSQNGTYEIDTDEIARRVNAYIQDRCDTDGNPIKPMSEASLMDAIGVHKRETYLSWLDGYVNPEHRQDEGYTYNSSLSEALAQGQNKIAIYLLEDDSSKYAARIKERQAETMGYIGPSRATVTHEGSISLSNKWSKRSK